jgi:DNA-binding LacI/PurR family transcriptional regulator
MSRIAEEAGVSVSTVSRVLNNRAEVSEEVRRKVGEAIKRNAFVAAPISSRRLNVGVVFPVVLDGGPMGVYDSLALSGIAESLLARDMEATLIFHREGSGATLPEKLRARGCQAAVTLSSNKLEYCAQELSDCGIPIILLNGRWMMPRVGYVDCDGFDAGRQLGRHLASLGHRNVSFLQNLPIGNHIERYNGMKRGMSEVFRDGDFKLVEIPFVQAKYVFESGLRACENALKENPSASAIAGVNDEVAYGAIRAVSKAGLRIPEDVAVAGFDDYPLSSACNPPLTTVRQPVFEMGRMAGEAAAKAIAEGPACSKLPGTLVPCELIVRESTAKGANI